MDVVLLINRRARMYLRDPGLLDRARAAGSGRCRVVVTGSLDELDEVAAELASSRPRLVLLSGGDGSLMAGITALARHFGDGALPVVAPVPGGTAGTVARNWGVSGEPARCIHRLLTRPRRVLWRPTLRVADDGRARIGFITGTGLVASFFELYYQRGAPGYAGSARLVARIFAESFVGGPVAERVLRPLACTLQVDGAKLEPPAWSLICAAVVPNLGIHMLVTHRAAEDPLRPHLVATPLAPRELGPRAPLVLAGKPLGGAGSVDRLVSSFTVTFDGVGPYVLDGELLASSRVTVAAGPRIQVAHPT